MKQEKDTRTSQINLQLPTLQVAGIDVITVPSLNECNWEKAYSALDNECLGNERSYKWLFRVAACSVRRALLKRPI